MSKAAVAVGYTPNDLKFAAHAKLQSALMAAITSKNEARIASARDTLAASFAKAIKPGQELQLDNVSQAYKRKYPGPQTLSAAARFYPEKKCLRVAMQVVDANFGPPQVGDPEWEHSSVELFVSASGTDADLVHLFVVPDGPENGPRITGYAPRTRTFNASAVSGSWKRTEKGYDLEISIPWSELPGYSEKCKFIAAELALNTHVPDALCQLRLNGTIQPQQHTLGFGKLLMK